MEITKVYSTNGESFMQNFWIHHPLLHSMILPGLVILVMICVVILLKDGED